MAVEVHMLPIKAGDSTLIIERSRDRTYTVLIDGGLAKDEVVRYVKDQGILYLDLVILSHPDLDHLQGLLALVRSPDVSIGAIWCFDLAFLRDFVETGKMPRPQDGTHTVAYESCCYSLVTQHEVLKEANVRGIRVLQVSEGHRANVGSLHLEVLYPWDGFYNALRDPGRLKLLLMKRWPEDWRAQDREEQGGGTRELTRNDRSDILRGILREYSNRPERTEAQPLAEVNAEAEIDEERLEKEADVFPASMLGTLYNNLSIVVKVYVLGGIDMPVMLFPGDLTDWTYLVSRRSEDIRSHIFKYPHHGSMGPGISRRVWDHLPFPGCPWCHCRHCLQYHDTRPCLFRCCGSRRSRLKEVWHAVSSYAGAELLANLVLPKHTLIFPYPSQGLPKSGVLIRKLGHIHTNRGPIKSVIRHHLRPRPPSPLVLTVGREAGEIAVKCES